MTVQQVDSLTPDQVLQLHALYQKEWWTEGRALADVVEMLEQTPLIVALVDDESGELLGFARILTDFHYHAMIFDVMVKADHRSRGLGRRVMQALVEHPRLSRVRVLWLCCLPEMMPFYEKFAFSPDNGGIHWMRRLRPSREEIENGSELPA